MDRDDGGDAYGQSPGGVVVLGSLNMDLVVTASEIPRPGQTVLGGAVTRRPGGKGANQAVAAARLGGDVQLIGRLGCDEFADEVRSALLDAGVDMRHVRSMHNVVSGTAFITLDSRGENAIVVSPGANAELTPEAVDAEAGALRGSSIAVTQLETPLSAVLRFAEHCELQGVELLLNAAPYRPVPAELLRRCTYLVINRDEAVSLTGIDVRERGDAYRAADEACRQGAAGVVITLGGEGCVALRDGTYVELDAYEVPVVDTTGAGDAFVGALAAALSRGRAFEDALTFAAAAGAATCTHLGAQNPTTDQEVQRLLFQQPRVPRRIPASQVFPSILPSDGRGGLHGATHDEQG